MSNDDLINAMNRLSDQLEAFGSIFSKRSPYGVPIVEANPLPILSSGQSYVITSIDFADKTTWYQNAAYCTDIALTHSVGNTYIFPSTETLINGTGRMYNTNAWNRFSALKNAIPAMDGGFITVNLGGGLILPVYKDYFSLNFKDNGVAIDASDIDSITYTAPASVTFKTAKTAPVSATYWKANTVLGGQYILKPAAGKKYVLQKAEAQLSKNGTIVTGGFEFQIWKEIASPSTLTQDSDWLTAMYEGKFAGATPLESAQDMINQNNEGVYIPGPIWNIQNDIMILPLEYSAKGCLELRSSHNEFFRCVLLPGTVLQDFEIATVTFYLREEVE